ncbi:DUF7848 domain-containing protein [Streptomyces koyangensis]
MRALLRHVVWRLGLASPVADLYAECVVCGERSPVVHDRDLEGGPEDWCIDHSGGHPSHRAFRAFVVSAWRTEPDDTVGDPSATG